MKMGKAGLGVAILAGVLLNAGCLVPEKFTAEATVNKERSYAFSYKGTMVYLPWRMEQERRGEDFDRRDAEMAGMASGLETEESDTFRKVHYAGNGVFNVDYASAGTLDETYYFPNDATRIIRFDAMDDGTIVVKTEGDAKDWDKLKQLGVEVSGKFSLKTDADVLAHNAGKTPGLFSKAYVWEIGPGKPLPSMILKGDGG